MRTNLGEVDFGRGALAGLVGTAALMAVLTLVPRLRRRKPVPVAELTGSFVAPDDADKARKIGYAAQVANGAAFAEAYALGLAALGRPSTPWTGMLFGAGLWFFGTMLATPTVLRWNPRVQAGKLENPGLFMHRLDHAPEHAATFLAAHVLYGAALGALYDHRTAPQS